MENKINEITITPKFEIGTEFWIMINNRAELGLIAAYSVYVTSCTDHTRSWHEQLFSRWRNKKAKDFYSYSYEYEVKLNCEIAKSTIQEKNGKWFLYGRPIYFSIDELRSGIGSEK